MTNRYISCVRFHWRPISLDAARSLDCIPQSRDESIIRSIKPVNREMEIFPWKMDRRSSSISRISRAEGVEKKVIFFFFYGIRSRSTKVAKYTRKLLLLTMRLVYQLFLGYNNIHLTIQKHSLRRAIDRSITILLRFVINFWRNWGGIA